MINYLHLKKREFITKSNSGRANAGPLSALPFHLPAAMHLVEIVGSWEDRNVLSAQRYGTAHKR